MTDGSVTPTENVFEPTTYEELSNLVGYYLERISIFHEQGLAMNFLNSIQAKLITLNKANANIRTS